MRKAFMLLMLGAHLANAQSWCPPGAQWTYEAGMFLAGFNRMSYTHDTLIAGFNAQVIDRYSAIQYPQPPPDPLFSGPPYISYTPISVITRSEADVVYTLQGGVWDTLYWFGAVPGDRWFPSHINDTTCMPLIVTDTGTIVIDGVPLRRLEVAGYTVIERIGCTWDMFLYCPNWIIDGPMGMRCYRDNEISSGSDCEALVGVDEKTEEERPICAPNPGTDHFTLSLPPGTHAITLVDATGRAVLHQNANGGRAIFDTAGLPSGIYFVRIDHGVQPVRWVKE
jgi:hypothetical protein